MLYLIAQGKPPPLVRRAPWRGRSRSRRDRVSIAQRFRSCRLTRRRGARMSRPVAAFAGSSFDDTGVHPPDRSVVPGRTSRPSSADPFFQPRSSLANLPTGSNRIAARSIPFSLINFLRWKAVHAHHHSIRTFSRPRCRNGRSPITCLITAFGVSARCARRAYAARPCGVFSHSGHSGHSGPFGTVTYFSLQSLFLPSVESLSVDGQHR